MKQLLVDFTAHESGLFIMMGTLMLILGIFFVFARFEENGHRIFPVWANAVILLFGLFLSVGMGWVMPTLDGKSPYQVVAQGVYQETTYSATGGLISQPFTVIHFADGSTVFIPGTHNVPFSKNTAIVVEKNKRYFKVESR